MVLELPRIRLPLVIGAAAVASAVVALPVARSFGGCTPVPVDPPSGYHASAADELCGVKVSTAKSVPAGNVPREHIAIRWRRGYSGWGELRLHSIEAAARDMPGKVPDFAGPEFRRLGRLEVAIVSDPKRFPDAESQEDTVIVHSGGAFVWLIDGEGYGLTVDDLRGWGVGCACGRTVLLPKGTTGLLMGYQTGELPSDPDSVVWLDGTGRLWTVMAPRGAFGDARLIAFARTVRSLQPFWCIPLFSWCA